MERSSETADFLNLLRSFETERTIRTSDPDTAGPDPNQRRKLCFVTVGATAPFAALLHAVLHPRFLQALASHDYTDLLLQHGDGGDIILERAVPARPDGRRYAHGLRIAGFAFNEAGLKEEYMSVKGLREMYELEGCVVSHAGMFFVTTSCRVGLAVLKMKTNAQKLTNPNIRLRKHTRRPTAGDPTHRRTKPVTTRQPSGGASRGAGEAGLCRAREDGEQVRTSWGRGSGDRTSERAAGSGEAEGEEHDLAACQLWATAWEAEDEWRYWKGHG